MSTITKELAKLFRKITNSEIDAEGNAHVVLSPADSLLINNARIALASLEAEASGRNPVLSYADSYRNMANHGVESIPVWSVITDLERNIAPLFTAPPAPVSVPDEDLLHMAASAIEDLLSNKDRSGAGVWADVPAKLRRAAMLQGAEPAQEWIPCSERMPEQFKAILVFNEYGEVWSGAYDRYWNFYCDNELVECVTHWMPLPNPPKE
ncbi:TPA: DUF551 domain-containing protein [Enterobacter roggenkampii]|uniref:DUF551 domain-containing protein n=1 Tax=Enterobacter roggenkampii TaxID=1812935 RepID=UPI003C7011E6